MHTPLDFPIDEVVGNRRSSGRGRVHLLDGPLPSFFRFDLSVTVQRSGDDELGESSWAHATHLAELGIAREITGKVRNHVFSTRTDSNGRPPD